jgi:sodium transport system ATP-binding protein
MVRTHELVKEFSDPKKGKIKVLNEVNRELVELSSDPKKGKITAVNNVSFVAEPGKILGLLGVNGAGKTTTLRMLSTIIKPTSGTAEVAGFDVMKNPTQVRANIGFMSTSTALYGRLTATEMIEYFGTLYDMSGERLKERLRYVKDKLDIHEFEDRLCDKLSTGQKQRVSIARTILHDPPVLFFDEPTAGLDVVASQTVMEFIEEERDHGKTVVFSTHIMSEVERLCDEVCIIHDGAVVHAGSVQSMHEATGETRLEAAFLKLVGFQPTYRPEVVR